MPPHNPATLQSPTAVLTCGLLSSSATLRPSHDIEWFVGSTVEFLPLAAEPGDQQCNPEALGEFPKLSDCCVIKIQAELPELLAQGAERKALVTLFKKPNMTIASEKSNDRAMGLQEQIKLQFRHVQAVA